MPKVAEWPWWHQQTGKTDYRTRELLRAVLDLHGYFGDPNIWLWRGQANSAHPLAPGIHTRIQKAGKTLDDATVVAEAENLLGSARAANLDSHEGTNLPDLALLAMLQHHGAATPLLDVSLDPLVALYMAVVSPNPADDTKDGVLFAIKRPPTPKPEMLLRPFDTRQVGAVYDDLPTDGVVLYSAPDVSERLRIQRGHFLLGRTSLIEPRVTIPLSIDSSSLPVTWLARRMNQRGEHGKPVPATSDVAVFRVTASYKPLLKAWLEERTGLTAEFVYPTAWHQPHLEVFANSQSRLARI
jgi:hypothetical protein